MARSYKGYRIGTIEKGLLQLFLGVKDKELPYRGEYEPTYSDIFTTARQKAGFSRTFQQLKKKGLITFKNREGVVVASLTSHGKAFVQQRLFANKPSNKNTVWDKKWRVIIFDIPENRRVARDMLRSRLQEYGCKPIQGSVWVYPYPCEDIITLIKTYFELGEEVLYLVVESLEGDKNLRKRFKLT